MANEDSNQIGRSAWLIAIAAGLIVFGLNLCLSLYFNRLGAFEEKNIIFQADPFWRLKSFTTGLGWGDHNLFHPNLGNFFSFPLRITAKVIESSGLYSGDPDALRRGLAMLIVPFFSGATTASLFLGMRRFGLNSTKSIACALLAAVSFSQLIFGSIPDHFAIGSFCLAASFALAVDMIRNEGKIRWIAWIALGVFTTGITSTNFAWLGLFFFAALLQVRKNIFTTLRECLIFGAITAILTIITSIAGAKAIGVPSPFDAPEEVKQSYLVEAATEKGLLTLVYAPAAIADTLTPGSIRTDPNEVALAEGEGRPYRFTLIGSHSALPMLLILPLLGLGAYGAWKDASLHRPLLLASLVILAGNLTLHSILGQEFFVYSQHWLVPLIVILAGNFRLPERLQTIGAYGIYALLAVMLINNARLLNEIFTTLSADL